MQNLKVGLSNEGLDWRFMVEDHILKITKLKAENVLSQYIFFYLVSSSFEFFADKNLCHSFNKSLILCETERGRPCSYHTLQQLVPSLCKEKKKKIIDTPHMSCDT